MNYSELKKEWIITNGLNGYSSSTLFCCNTRKYHGLLVVDINGTRNILLNKLDEEILVDDKKFELSTNEYDIVHPKGYEYLEGFSFDFYPEFSYKINTDDNKKIIVKKKIEMPNANLVMITYFIESEKRCIFRALPLIGFRGVNQINIKRNYLVLNERISADNIDLYFYCHNSDFKKDEKWYYNFHYNIEKERGYEFKEDLFNPGYFETLLLPGKKEIKILFSYEPTSIQDAENLIKIETCRKCKLISDFYKKTKLKQDEFLNMLIIAADSFVVSKSSEKQSEKHIVAGYPWFGYYTRDALISFEGIFLCNRRFREAEIFLRGMIERLEKGLLPNIITEKKALPEERNSVDSPFLLIHAVKRYFDYTKDTYFLKRYYSQLISIIDNYVQGTYFGIRMDSDYLIKDEDGSLTWMDAKVNGLPVIERKKGVEIQVLWYNALMIMEDFSKKLKIRFKYKGLSRKVKYSFQKYWNGKYLNDNENDSSIRPNMLYEIAMPYQLLARMQERQMLRVIERELLSCYGLRTLSPKDKNYTGIYSGSQEHRDLSYHNGTVWPYLLGIYVDASLKLNSSKSNRERLRKILYNLKVSRLAVNSLPEIYEASTFRPDGCISQAWSVAEVLRAIVKINSFNKEKKR